MFDGSIEALLQKDVLEQNYLSMLRGGRRDLSTKSVRQMLSDNVHEKFLNN